MTPLLSIDMPLQHLRADLRRLTLSLMAIALGVALVVAVLLMNDVVLTSFIATIDDLVGHAHLTVSAGEDATFPEQIAEVVGAVPGVKLAVPLVSSTAFPDDGSGRLLTVFGIDLLNDAHVRAYQSDATSDGVIHDFVEFLSQPNSVVLTREYAQHSGLQIGDSLSLVTPHGVRQFILRGLLEPEGLARTLGGRLVIMDLPSAQRAFTEPGQVSQIDVILSDPSSVEAVRAEIIRALPPGLVVEEPVARKAVARATVRGIQAMLAGLAILCVAAGFLICYSRLSAIFESRTWEVGLFRAVGLSRLVVAVDLLKEGLLLGVMGCGLGIPLGLLIARQALPSVQATITATYRLPLFGPPPELRFRAILLGAAVGIGATILAALAPSIRLARRQPVAALTMRGRYVIPSSSRVRLAGPFALLLMIFISSALQVWTGRVAFGQVTTALVAIMACVIAPAYVRLFSRGLGEYASRVAGTEGQFALEQIGLDTRRSGLAVATFGLGVGIVIFLALLGHSFESTVVSLFSDSLRADLIVSSQLQVASYRSAPIGDELVHQIAALPGVEAVSGEQSKDQHFKDQSIVLKSFDSTAFTTSVYKWPLELGALPNALLRVARGEAILVTRAFAFQTGMRPGDTFTLTTPAGPRAFLVAGIATGQMENAIVLSRQFYRDNWNDSDVYLIHVAVKPGATIDGVRQQIEQSYGERYRVRVRTGPELVAYLKSEAHKAFIVCYVLDAIILLLVMIAISDNLATAVVERTREFGLLRAVGMAKHSVAKIILAEGATLAALGMVLGVILGITLGVFWVTVQFPALLGWGLDLHVPLGFTSLTLVVAFMLSLLGATAPSVRAARLSVVQALRQE